MDGDRKGLGVITPISLRMQRFGSVSDDETFTFPDKPGLYFLSGKNGAGKSTVWKALTWVIFGKDAKGLKAGDVANWKDPKGATVEFDFDWLSVRYTVVRTHSPNTWLLRHGTFDEGGQIDLTNDETNQLLALLKLDYTMWCNTIVLAQDEPMFLDLKPEAKSTLFASVMNLDKWDTYSDNASERAKTASGRIADLTRESARFGGILEGLEAVGREIPERIDVWEKAQKIHTLALTGQYEAAMRERPKLQEAFEKATTEIAVCQLERQKRLEQQTDAQALIDGARRALNEIDRDYAVAGANINRLIKLIDTFEESDTCPLCGASHKDVQRALAGTKAEFARARQARDLLQEARNPAEAALKSAQDTFAAACDRADKARSNLDASGHSLRAARIAVEANTGMLDRIEEQADALKDEINPHKRDADLAAEDRRRVAAQLHGVVRELDEATERHALMGFWVRGFKELRLHLIAEALDQLSLEVAGCVEQKGLRGWSLTFEVDRETKKGTIARGFNVFVKSPANDKQVPWEAWSGGEAQRLRVACQEGLANLIRSSTGADLPLEVWDEPSHGMEAQGLADLLEGLRDRAHAEHRQIWVTDHHALGSAAFDGTVTVTKTRGGTKYGAME